MADNRLAQEVFFAGTHGGEYGEWLQAWQAERAEGIETLLLDAHNQSLSVWGLDPDAHRVTQLVWRPPSPDSVWAADPAPSRVGIRETENAEPFIARTWPALPWSSGSPVVRGKGVFFYPLGPVRADVAESVEYRLAVMGDEMIHVDLRAGFKRRHVRTLVVGRYIDEAWPVVTRFTTTSNVHHTLAMALAVEKAWDISVSPTHTLLRTLFAELERIVSHLGDLAVLAVSTGLPLPQMEYLHLKELVLRLNYRLFGHRYLRDLIVPGGVQLTQWPQKADVTWALNTLATVYRQSSDIASGLLNTPSFLDRLHGAGVIPASTVAQVRPVGPVGRASGVSFDVRQALPYVAYVSHPIQPCVETSGDAYARFQVRVRELSVSLSLARILLEEWRDLDTGVQAARVLQMLKGPPLYSPGLGIVEAPRGLLVYGLYPHKDSGRIEHLAVATPSMRNWSAVPEAMANHNIMQDFPIIDASFSLSVSGWDG
ncbi:MAG: hydrogenase-3 subunit E [Firmicutes bacterium]|nr:hydrogenase-3 subunit E [Bacillota bacterium]